LPSVTLGLPITNQRVPVVGGNVLALQIVSEHARPRRFAGGLRLKLTNGETAIVHRSQMVAYARATGYRIPK
jgi:hypothetical protein